MNIALIGHGNMGKEIEALVRERGEHTIVYTGGGRDEALDVEALRRADVAIEFTAPEQVLENIRTISALGIPLVVGTTGWYERLDEVKALVQKSGTGLIYGENFSIGANIFFQIVAFSSRLFSRFGLPGQGGYDVFARETHHAGKKDSPSGTARKLAQIIMENFPTKKVLQTGALDRQVRGDELHFSSVRGGHNRGRHEIIFDSAADEVTLAHQAHSRRGFAAGALAAAEFIKGKKGVYAFDALFTSQQTTYD